MKKTIFISDLHLDEAHPAGAAIFKHFMQTLDLDTDALYILGDLFESWIGDDDLSDFNQEMMRIIKSVSDKGIPVYVLHGNRDFLIGKRFIDATGSKLLPDETIISVYGTPVLLMHGDTLCTRDVAYLKSRKWLRNHFIQTLFLMLPLRYRKSFATKVRDKSRQHVAITSMDIMDVTHSEVKKIMQHHQVHYLVHGHTHRLAMHQFTLDHTPAMRIVLGAWHHHGSALIWDDQGGKQLIDLTGPVKSA